MSTWCSMPMVIMGKDKRFTGVIFADSIMIVAIACALSFNPMLANEPMRAVWTVYPLISDILQEAYITTSTYDKPD